MVPVQRERVVPPVPAEKTEGGAMDRPLLHRRARAAQGRPQEIQATKALPAVARPEWLGRGWSPLLISGRLRVLWPDDALMRVCPETIYRWVYSSRPLRERWARCLPRGHRRRRRHGGRRTSRFPIPGRVPLSQRPPAIGRPTASSEWDATCTPRWRGGPGSSWPASFRTRPPARASGRSWTCSRRCRR